MLPHSFAMQIAIILEHANSLFAASKTHTARGTPKISFVRKQKPNRSWSKCYRKANRPVFSHWSSDWGFSMGSVGRSWKAHTTNSKFWRFPNTHSPNTQSTLSSPRKHHRDTTALDANRTLIWKWKTHPNNKFDFRQLFLFNFFGR